MVVEAVEVDRVAAAVVQRGIGDQADTTLGGFDAQALEIGIAAEGRVDLLVIGRVVFVIAGRLEYRRHVNHVGAELRDVVELADDACQVAAKEVVVVDRIAAISRTRLPGFVEPVLV